MTQLNFKRHLIKNQLQAHVQKFKFVRGVRFMDAHSSEVNVVVEHL